MYFLFVTFMCLQVIGLEKSESAAISGLASSELSDGPYIEALKYLGQYGYLDKVKVKVNNFSMFDSFEESIKGFQGFFGLKESGELDNDTVTAMRKPRCGVRDVEMQEGEVKEMELYRGPGKKRQKRYSFYDGFVFQDIMDMIGSRMRPFDTPSSRWRSQDLTYRISKYPSAVKMSKKMVQKQIREAFSLWSRETDLTFTERTYGPVHIDIRFESRDHGDGDSFDGPGGVLAHSYYPIYGGDVHFDADERWVIQSEFVGTHLMHVAAHEFGHALGLPHIGDSSALMAPTIDDSRVYDVKLGAEDVKAIQGLYGLKTKEPVTTQRHQHSQVTTTTTQKPSLWNRLLPSLGFGEHDSDSKIGSHSPASPTICERGELGSIVRVGETAYVVSGVEVWEMGESGGLVRDKAHSIAATWPGLPRYPDAGFTWHNGLEYIFVGSKYYRYRNRTLDKGFPKRLSKGFSGVPSYLDAAFVRDNQIYFIKKNKYWIFSPKSSPPISKPKSIPAGISQKVVAGMTNLKNKTFLFSKDLYWRMEARQFVVDKLAEPPYPRRIKDWWWNCDKNRQEIRIETPPIAARLRAENSSSEGRLSGGLVAFVYFISQASYQHL